MLCLKHLVVRHGIWVLGGSLDFLILKQLYCNEIDCIVVMMMMMMI